MLLIYSVGIFACVKTFRAASISEKAAALAAGGAGHELLAVMGGPPARQVEACYSRSISCTPGL